MNTQESRPPSAPEPGEGAAGPTRPAWSTGTDEFFDRIRGLGAVRPDEGRWAAGVCAGLSRRWGLDPMLVRGVFVVGGLATGVGLGLYGLLWLLMPHPDGRIHAQQVLRGTVTAGFVGSAACVVFGFPLSGGWIGWRDGGWPFHSFGGAVWLVLIGLGIWWMATRGSRGPGGNGGPGWRGGPGWSGGPGPSGGSGWSGGTGWSGGSGTSGGPGTSGGSGDSGTSGGPGPAGGGAPYDAGPAQASAPAYGTPSATYGGGYAPAYGGIRAPEAAAPSPVADAPLVPAPVVTAAPPRRVDVQRPLHSLTLSTLGAAVLAASGVAIAGRLTGAIPAAPEVAIAAALGVVALGIVLAGALGRRAGGLAPIAILLAVAAVNGAIWHDTINGARGVVTWRPVAEPTSSYSRPAGKAVLDLTDPALVRTATTSAPVTVASSLGAGELIVVVPSGVTTRVHSSVGLGQITDDVAGRNAVDRGGPGLDQSDLHGTGSPVLEVNAEVGLGRVWIVPQGTEVDR